MKGLMIATVASAVVLAGCAAPTLGPRATLEPSPTPSPTATFTATPSATSSATCTPTPTLTPTNTPTPLPTATPTNTPVPPTPTPVIGTMQIGEITSHYTYSNVGTGLAGRIPAIIFVGHPFGHPTHNLERFRGQFDEPVLLIHSGLLMDWPETAIGVEDEEVWSRKSAQFLTLVRHYMEFFEIDETRIYLTGFSFDGAYAWMLSYDHPELYAGVVAMSAVSYPRQIQERIDSGAQVVTVVVRGELDHWFPARLAQEQETGGIIESLNPNSMWILKKAETHAEVSKYWQEYLRYILQFKKS